MLALVSTEARGPRHGSGALRRVDGNKRSNANNKLPSDLEETKSRSSPFQIVVQLHDSAMHRSAAPTRRTGEHRSRGDKLIEHRAMDREAAPLIWDRPRFELRALFLSQNYIFYTQICRIMCYII